MSIVKSVDAVSNQERLYGCPCNPEELKLNAELAGAAKRPDNLGDVTHLFFSCSYESDYIRFLVSSQAVSDFLSDWLVHFDFVRSVIH